MLRAMDDRLLSSVLVTGGAGFIGSHVAEALLRRGRRVAVLDNLSTGALVNLAGFRDLVTFINGSVADRTTVEQLVESADAVIHLAASVGNRVVSRHPLEAIENNLKGSTNVLEACARRHRPVAIASSSEVYGRSELMPFREDADLVIGPPNSSRWLYAAAKLMGEFEAMVHATHNDLPVVVARFFNVAGPRQAGRFGMVLPRFVRQALSGEPLSVYGSGDQQRCFCHVSELAEALLDLLECPAARGRIVNLGNTNRITMRELAVRIVARTASKSPVVTVPFAEVYGPGYDDMDRRQPDITVARELIGFSPRRTVDEIIDDVIAWQRENWSRLADESDY